MKTLDWIKTLELPTGGIADRPGGRAYPEVSGYLIPTLYDYGDLELATRLADWLLKVQKPDGSFPDLEGYSRTFDTAACMEGLERAAIERGNEHYQYAAQRARTWIRQLERPDGAILTSPGHDKTHLYTMRVSWLVGSKKGSRYWKKADWKDERTIKMRSHYAAYALEGLWGMCETEFVSKQLQQVRELIVDGLAPFWSEPGWYIGWDYDVCATAQLGILFIHAGIPADDLVEATSDQVRSDGSISQIRDILELNSWTAKWCLDFWKLAGGLS